MGGRYGPARPSVRHRGSARDGRPACRRMVGVGASAPAGGDDQRGRRGRENGGRGGGAIWFFFCTSTSTKLGIANLSVPQWFSLLDTNNNIQYNPGDLLSPGTQPPTWSPLHNTNSSSGITAGSTSDGSVQWLNAGPLGAWFANTVYYAFQCILDSNGNIQLSNPGTSGSTEPTWATTLGTTTSDGSVTWFCLGPGHTILTGNVYYGYRWVSTDGSITTSSPAVSLNINSAVLGPLGNP